MTSNMDLNFRRGKFGRHKKVYLVGDFAMRIWGCCRDCKIRVVLVWECAAPEGLDLLLGVGFQG